MEVHAIEGEEDLGPLRTAVSALVGQLCWKAELRNMEVLALELGERVSAPLRRDPDAVRGSWAVIVWSGAWRILTPGNSHDCGLDDESVFEHVRDIEGRVTSIGVSYPALRLTVGFEHGVFLRVGADAGGAAEHREKWQDWEVFTPQGSVVSLNASLRSWTLASESE